MPISYLLMFTFTSHHLYCKLQSTHCKLWSTYCFLLFLLLFLLLIASVALSLHFLTPFLHSRVTFLHLLAPSRTLAYLPCKYFLLIHAHLHSFALICIHLHSPACLCSFVQSSASFFTYVCMYIADKYLHIYQCLSDFAFQCFVHLSCACTHLPNNTTTTTTQEWLTTMTRVCAI